MKIGLFLFLVTFADVAAKPQPPVVRILNTGKIDSVVLHTDMDTMLIFPESIDLIIGKGLTDGSSAGSIQFQHGENANLVVLRCLEPKAEVLMQILIGDRVFVFRLRGGEDPASVIYFHGGEALGQVNPLPGGVAPRLGMPVTPERQSELIRLAVEASFLKSKLPKEYEGFASRPNIGTYSTSRIPTKISSIARFSAEDALIVVGTLRNDTGSVLEIGKIVGELRVSGKRVYPISKLNVSRLRLAVAQEAEFRCLLVGDGRGGSAHLSLENQFELQIRGGGKEGKK